MRLLPLIVAVAVCRASYTSGSSRRECSGDIPIDRILPPVIDSANRFAFLAYKSFAQGAWPPGIVLATSDLFLAHWAMSRGSVERTRTVFDAVFPPPNLTEADCEPGIQIISDRTRNLRDLDYNVTSGIFSLSGFPATANYKNIIRRGLQEEVHSLESNETNEAAETLNLLFSRATNNRVSEIVKPDDIGNDASLALVSHVSFRGSWIGRSAAIGDQIFHVDESFKVSTSFMQQYGVYSHGQLPTLDAKFVEIPYKNGVRKTGLSLFVILPNRIDGLSQLERNIHTIGLAQLLNANRTKLIIRMPPFGIGTRLSTGVSYKQSVTSRRTINKIIHYANFGVKEPSHTFWGVIEYYSPLNVFKRPYAPKFVADRPFVAVVATTGANPLVLFMARYLGPEGLA